MGLLKGDERGGMRCGGVRTRYNAGGSCGLADHVRGAMMSAPVEIDLPPLVRGDKLTREEFLRRWEAMPNVKFAELIGGIVYMPSPLSLGHGDRDNSVGTWLGVYAASTPGCQASNNATCLMEDDVPQPDSHLRLLADYGGQSWEEGLYSARRQSWRRRYACRARRTISTRSWAVPDSGRDRICGRIDA